MKEKVNKFVIRLILFEVIVFILYFILLVSVNFRDYYTPFVLSFVLINLSIFLYSTFSKIYKYKTEKKVYKKWFYSVINIFYSTALCIFVSEVILKISYFQDRN